MNSQEFSELAQILGGYLHQDWTAEFDSDTAALVDAANSEPKETVMSAVSQIDLLLGKSLTKDEYREYFIGTLGCYFDPGSIGITYPQWLARARDTLRSNL